MNETLNLQGKHLQQLLDEKNVKQKELAQRLGVSAITVNRWVMGKQRLSQKYAQLINDIWSDAPVAWLMGLSAEDAVVSDTIRISNRRAMAIIPTGKLQQAADEIAPFIHMTSEEIAAELIKAVDRMYERDGLKQIDNWIYGQAVDE